MSSPDPSTAIVAFEGVDLAMYSEDDFVANVGDSAFNAVFSGARVAPLHLLTTNSKLHSEKGFAPGTWAVGGPSPRTATMEVGQPFLFVPAALNTPRLRTVPTDSLEGDKGKVLCGALPVRDPKDPKKVTYKAAAPNGLYSPSGKTLVPRLEKIPGGKKGEELYKISGWDYPDDAEPTDDCAKCFYGPGRDPKGSNDRGFIDKKAVFCQDGARDGVVIDLPVPEELRKPAKTDCGLTHRMFGHVLCPSHNGMPAGWVPCFLTFRSTGFKTGEAVARLIGDWCADTRKQPWSHGIRIGAEGAENAAKIKYNKPVLIGLQQSPQVKDGQPVVDAQGAPKLAAWPVPGPKAAEAARAAGRTGVVDVQSLSLELKESLEPRDWFGWIDDLDDSYGSAAEDDAAHMPTEAPTPY